MVLRPPEGPSFQAIGDFRRMNFHPRHALSAGEGGVVQVLQHGGCRADQHQAVSERVALLQRLERPGLKQIPDWNRGDCARRSIGIQQGDPARMHCLGLGS